MSTHLFFFAILFGYDKTRNFAIWRHTTDFSFLFQNFYADDSRETNIISVKL